MADDVTYTAGANATPPDQTKATTDETSAGPHSVGSHMGVAKLAVSADGDSTHIPATDTDGLLVNVSNASIPTGGLTDAELRATPVDVDVTSSVLPTGASTEAKQDSEIALLTTVDGDTSTIAGAVAGSEMQVDVVASLPAGNNNIGDVDIASLPNEGQQTMANSISVTVASDQPALPISGTVTANVPEPLDVQEMILDDSGDPQYIGWQGGGGIPMPVSGVAGTGDPVSVDGGAAHDSPVSGNPVAIGGRASTAVPADVSADGDAAWLRTDRKGSLGVKVVDQTGNMMGLVSTTSGGLPIEGVNGDAIPSKMFILDAASAIQPIGAGAGGVPMPISDDGGSITVDGTVTAAAQPGVDIGDVTVNNAAGAAAVNIQDGGNTITVDGTVTADTELPAAALLSDTTANPTVPGVGAFGMFWDPANSEWVRAQITQGMSGAVHALNAMPISYNGTPLNVANFGDGDPGNALIQQQMLFNGTNWDRARGDTANGLDVDVTRLPAITGTVTANQGTAGTAWEVVGDVAQDAAIAGNPLPEGGRASAALPTAMSADGDSVYQWLSRNGAAITALLPHLGTYAADPYTLTAVTAQYTTTQTSTILINPGASERIAITSIQIQAGGTTSGTLQVYFGTGAYSRGTSLAIFDGEFAPSATLKPGFALAPPKPWVAATANDDLRVTTSAAINPLTITVWYYLIS